MSTYTMHAKYFAPEQMLRCGSLEGVVFPLAPPCLNPRTAQADGFFNSNRPCQRITQSCHAVRERGCRFPPHNGVLIRSYLERGSPLFCAKH